MLNLLLMLNLLIYANRENDIVLLFISFLPKKSKHSFYVLHSLHGIYHINRKR